MSKLNKLVTNYPVSLSEKEVENLSATLAPVVAACGGGGGGTGGKIYNGIGFVSVNNSTNQIGLTEAANTKLNQDIPTKVSDLSDSANYQTVVGMNEYLTTADASTTYQIKEDMSAYYKKTETSSKSELDDEFSKYATVNQLVGEISNVTQTIDILQGTVDGKQDILTFDYDENDAISSINSHKLAGQGGVTGDYYSASNPSGFITPTTLEPILQNKHYVTSSNEIIQGSAQYGLTTAGWTVIQGAGGGTGITEVSHDTTLTGNGNSQALGVNFNHVQPKGDYVSATAISDMATQTWVEQKNYLTQVPSEYITETELAGYNYATTALLDTISSKIENDIPSIAGLATKTDLQNVSAGVDYVSAHAITAHQPLTDYYTKSETSGASEIENALTGKQDKLTFAGESNTITSINNSAVGGGTSFTGVTTASPITGDGLNNTLGLDSNYKTAIEQVSGKVDKPADMTSNIPYCFSAGQWADITQTYYSKTEATGTFLQKHLTNTLSGDGTSNNTLGVNWSNLSSNLINSANTASNAWISGTEFSSFAQIKTAIDSKQSASDYVHISGDTMTGGLTISASSGKNVLAVASAASLLGASRQTSANYGVNDTALGTTWMGVGGPGMYRGFLKYTQGGNVGDLDTDNTMQVEFTPNNKGTIFAKAKNNGTDCPETQILNPVKTTCDNMSASGIDANNMSGPNYMIAKNADGQFVIGAAVFNCQNNLPGTLQPNTYYFVY